ncbi:MAG: M3 family metallopeptidase, partial [Bdellovibrionota bacterium]
MKAMRARFLAVGLLLGVALVASSCNEVSKPTGGLNSKDSAAANPVRPTHTPHPGGGAHKPVKYEKNLIPSDFQPGELERECKEAIAEARRRFDAIAAIPAADRTTDNTLLAFERTMGDLVDRSTPLSFMGYVHTDGKVSDEGSACEQAVNDFSSESFSRKELYDAVSSAKGRNADEARLSYETLTTFESNGLKLPDDGRAKVLELNKKINENQSAFTSNLNHDTSSVAFTDEELKGLAPLFLARLKKDDSGKTLVSTKENDYLEFMQNAENSEARRKMAMAYNDRQGPANTKLLEETIELRRQAAKLMNYPTWADFRIHGRMASDAKTVMGFLNDLKGKLAVGARNDMAELLAFKKTLDPSATEVKIWDIQYLQYQKQKKEQNLDNEKIREYFPKDVVVAGMFEVYSKMLGVHFVEVAGAHVWSDGVKLYEI